MEQWTFKNYVKPTILTRVDQIDERNFELDDGYNSYSISVDSADGSLFIKSLMKNGEHSESFDFESLSDWQRAFLDELEGFGGIGEGSEFKLTSSNDENQKHIAEALEAYKLSSNADAALESVKVAKRQLLQILSGERLDVDREIHGEWNFFRKVLCMQFLSWRHVCPPALIAASHLVGCILNDYVRTEECVDSGIYPDSEIRRCLLCVIWALTRSADVDNVTKLDGLLPNITSDDHAINLGILAEKHALKALDMLGSSIFLEGLASNDHKRVLACAGYSQEFYITNRFVDLIAPTLSKRLPRNLKSLVRRYYNEEVGHESFELKTCVSLGMKKVDLLDSLPSPFGQVICDVFSWLAHDEPLAYFSTISITEGLPGQRNPINQAVLDGNLLPENVKLGSMKHEDLNFKLFHQMLPRWFLSQCGVLSVANQLRTMRFYNTMLEISFRAWEELYRIHIEGAAPLNPRKMTDYIK